MRKPPARPPLPLRLLDWVASSLALLAGFAVFVLALMIGFDVLARRFAGFSVQGTDELGGYTLALIGSLGLAYALMRRRHTRIDILLPYMPERIARALDALAVATLAGFAVFIADHAWVAFEETWTFDSLANTPLQTPLWIPQAFWLAGTIAFAVCALAQALHAGWLLLRAPDRIAPFYGPLTTQEELQEFQEERSGSGPAPTLR
ncbi:TRAP transporter small permease [Falsiroseomonas bella]|uniref:TRAP transporter small permease protein n=1 Tax=Falsiroseomonas bella TaxID=2184016 RepID=A0A317FIR1_9PROT|nr:TRAP transporter small permease [Falsiroseomonas bella]PWS37967.1 TRAP transporter small permease [Falsiroseomonas bella]